MSIGDVRGAIDRRDWPELHRLIKDGGPMLANYVFGSRNEEAINVARCSTDQDHVAVAKTVMPFLDFTDYDVYAWCQFPYGYVGRHVPPSGMCAYPYEYMLKFMSPREVEELLHDGTLPEHMERCGIDPSPAGVMTMSYDAAEYQLYTLHREGAKNLPDPDHHRFISDVLERAAKMTEYSCISIERDGRVTAFDTWSDVLRTLEF